MSVLDFFVSKSGYMANSYLTDESTDVLVEAAGDEIALDNCVDKWLASTGVCCIKRTHSNIV